MNKALMHAVTGHLLHAAADAALTNAILGRPELSEQQKQALIFIGILRWHGLLPDEWIGASIVRQYKFAQRDGLVPPGDDAVRDFQKKIMKLLETASEFYEMKMKKYETDISKQPKFDNLIGKETHDAIAKASGG